MRRTLIMTLASTAVLAVAPGAALAHGHHHSGKHKGHRHAKVETFGTDTSTQQPSSSDTAGTVSSFSGGVLVIKLNDGSMVSGKVTPDTEISCQAPSQTTSGGGDENGGDGDQNSGGDNEDQQSGAGGSQTAGGNEASDTGENDASETDNEGQSQPACDSSALTTGAVVREAELKLTGSGATWKQVDLQK
jgi:hypothetical protein